MFDIKTRVLRTKAGMAIMRVNISDALPYLNEISRYRKLNRTELVMRVLSLLTSGETNFARIEIHNALKEIADVDLTSHYLRGYLQFLLAEMDEDLDSSQKNSSRNQRKSWSEGSRKAIPGLILLKGNFGPRSWIHRF